MKSLVLFVAASLMLVGGMVAVTIPDTIHAEKPNVQWCREGTGNCAETKQECNALIDVTDAKCVKVKDFG